MSCTKFLPRTCFLWILFNIFLFAFYGQNIVPGTMASECAKTGMKFLKSKSGHDCIGECRRGGISIGFATFCYTSLRKGGPKWDFCTPNEDYKIQEFACKNILTTRGIPCKTECKTTTTFSFNWCTTIEPYKYSYKSWKHTWDYCSPNPGRDYYGRLCLGSCGYGLEGKNHKWCHVLFGSNKNSWGYCS